jgi:hypothetical protein
MVEHKSKRNSVVLTDMPLQNLLTVAVIFAFVTLFMVFRERIVGAFQRFRSAERGATRR